MNKKLFKLLLIFFFIPLFFVNGGVVNIAVEEGSIQTNNINSCDEERDYGIVGYGGPCDDRKGYEAFTSLIQNALNWIIGIAFLIAVLAIFYAGFVLLTASGQPAKRTQALSILKNVIIGLFFIAAAWLLVDWFFGLFGLEDYQFTKNN